MKRHLRILHVSKFRRVTGGVERHIQALMSGQSEVGHAAELFSSEDVDGELNLTDVRATPMRERMSAAASILWSKRSEQAIDRRIEAFSPDIIHYHSIYHQLSPSVLRAHRYGVPSVMTLHDYKLSAPCYLLLRDGSQCFNCVGRRVPIDAVRFKCIKSSRSASALCGLEQVVHRSRYQREISCFITPSEFATSIAVSSGAADAKSVVTVPHGVRSVRRNPAPHRSKHVLFIGRMMPEKGVADLCRAWKQVAHTSTMELKFLGDGPESRQLQDPDLRRVVHVGWQDGTAIDVALQAARAVVVPSRFCETFGLVAAEAMAAGVPLIVSDAGALPEHVTKAGSGMVFPTEDVGALAGLLQRLEDDTLVADMGARGYEYARRRLTVDRMVSETTAVYRTVLNSAGP